MTKPMLATTKQIDDFLARRPEWILRNGALHREYRFADFVEAFGFMTEAALVAEAMNHHPEWRNVYRAVTVDLLTHEAKGISERDFQLAEAMERIAARRRPREDG